MKVIFKQTNEIKNVSFGYAANYLIPQGLAVLATEEAIKKIEKQEEKDKVEKVEKNRKSRKRAQVFKDKKFVIEKKARKDGKLYGSVSKKEIAEKVGVEKGEVVLREPIKKIGEHEIELKIGEEKVKVKVKVRNS